MEVTQKKGGGFMNHNEQKNETLRVISIGRPSLEHLTVEEQQSFYTILLAQIKKLAQEERSASKWSAEKLDKSFPKV